MRGELLKTIYILAIEIEKERIETKVGIQCEDEMWYTGVSQNPNTLLLTAHLRGRCLLLYRTHLWVISKLKFASTIGS